ncbi:MAG: Hsp20/alpha crystallin family protein [bacterium]
MAIIRWSPFKDILRMQEEMNKLFDNFFNRSALPTTEGRLFSPPIDLVETDEDYRIKVDLPGISKDDMSISAVGNSIVVKGEKRQEKKEEKENYHYMERFYGSFKRVIDLPSDIEADKISAEFTNGVLEIIVPKTEKVKPKEIEIKVRDKEKK